MATGTPLPAFEHDPLPEHTSHFRLLYITRGDFGQHVECDMLAWPIDKAPPYCAISYTWGDPADTTVITVNGRPLVVRRNCEYVLQQAFASRTSVYFWVDAICIAQTTKEKNHQVGIMDQIYSGAKHVLACVGPHENDSQFLSKTIQKHGSLLKTIHELRDKGWPYSFGYNPIEHHNRVLFRCLVSMKPRARQRLYQSFSSFMKRPYFKRLWIIQELHLAQRVSYCFGVAVEAAEDFFALYKLLGIWVNTLRNNEPYPLVVIPLAYLARYTVAYSRTKASQAMQPILNGLGTLPSRLYFSCSTEKQKVQNILLDPDLQCTDPRDRLFGILSVVGQLPEGFPKPDYTKDGFEVALEAFRLLSTSDTNPAFSWARKLCHYFRVTEEEASLRNALAVRSSTSRAKAMPGGLDVHRLVLPYYYWLGFKIFWDEEDLALSGPIGSRDLGMYVSAGVHEGCRSLHFKGCTETISISAPRSTRSGDWWLFYDARWEEIPLGFVVRRSKGGKYNVIGQTYQVDFDYAIWRAAFFRYGYKTVGYWYPEDVLLLGWILNELGSHDVTQDKIREYVNRLICAWDGSTYFQIAGQ